VVWCGCGRRRTRGSLWVALIRSEGDDVRSYNAAEVDDLAWEHELLSSFREGTTRSSLGRGGGFSAKWIDLQTACRQALYMPLGRKEPEASHGR
jgi:hypothetical protein